MKWSEIYTIFRRLTGRLAAGGVAALALGSCGEFLDFETQQLVQAEAMTIGRRVFPMVVGDSYRIPVSFQPDSISNPAVFWLSDDEEVAYFRNDTLRADHEGTARLIAFTTIDRLRDTCWVAVLPTLYRAPTDYPYDMVVYASVSVNGLQLNADNADGYVIAAYVGEQVRGIGQMRRSHGIDYMELRVWSPFPAGETVTVRCYFRGQARMEQLPATLSFNGAMVGSLSDPYPLVFDEQATEYVPDIEPEGHNPIIDPNDSIHVVVKSEK